MTASARVKALLPTALAVTAIVVFWELFNVVTDSPDYILPPLHKIVATALTRSATLLPAAGVTLTEILAGFFAGSGVGFVLGVLVFHSVTARRSIMPLIIATQAIPVIAIAPVFIIWFGFGMLSKIVVAAMIAFFPVVVTTIAGLGAIEIESIHLLRSLDASRASIFWKARFPAALPFIFAGLRNAAAISVIGAIVGEWVGAREGLGPIMLAANSSFRTDVVFAAILYLAVIGTSLFAIVNLAERILIPWHFIGGERGR